MKWYVNLLISIIVFFVGTGIAYLTGSYIVLNAVILAFLIQWVAYIPAYTFQTEKFYDLTGTLTYLTVVWFTYMLSNSAAEPKIGNLILASLISIWAVRLGSFLFLRIHKAGEDKRFRTIKPSASQFFMTWTLQGFWVSICSMCALTAISSEVGVIINIFFYIGVALFLIGFSIEIVADNQKNTFRSLEENKDKFITSGLWAKSRHPNYFGEIMLWTAIALIALPSLGGAQYLTLISPIFTYILLVHISGVRMLEDMGNKKWGHLQEYRDYKDKTPRIIPKF
jgi:Predicted membrane protein